jgi:hypothetical protein
MNPTNSSANTASPRPTLKLKTGARKSSPEPATAALPSPRPHNPNKNKPGAHWSDDFKQRMQADMDMLSD